MIELQHIHKTFGDVIALNDVSLLVQEGEIFGIIGKSGAGKSSLLRIINRLETADSGDIIIDNEKITNINAKKLQLIRHKIGMIFQQFNLLSAKNVFDNIALPMRIQHIPESEISKKIDELLNLVELTDKRFAYPSELSGGQKQRVAIARALACSPKILLCDEATSALDPETTESILSLLQKINQKYGITIVLITHEMDVIKRICHRVSVMEQGKLIETVGLSEAFSKKGSVAGQMLFAKLTPKIPKSMTSYISQVPNEHPLIRIFFQGREATIPFISHVSRNLHLDVNILLANIDHIDDKFFGIMLIELEAPKQKIQQFIDECHRYHLTTEVIGYVADTLV